MILVVSLYVRNPVKFEEFEVLAVAIMARHGGKIERRIRLQPGENTPTEAHIVTFLSPEAVANYRADPELLRYKELRESAISETTIWSGEEINLP